jgi:hypothetical protein
VCICPWREGDRSFSVTKPVSLSITTRAIWHSVLLKERNPNTILLAMAYKTRTLHNIKVLPCGGGIEYLHRSPTNRKRRRKGNLVPGGISGPPCSWGYKHGDLALKVEGVSRIGTIIYGLESRGTQTRAGLRWRGSAATVNYRPVLLSERVVQNNKPTTV